MPFGIARRLAVRLPWWLVGLLALAAVALGAVLTADPFRSLSVLASLGGAALVVSGAGELATAATSAAPWRSRLVGAVWLAGGVVAVSARGLAIHVLAITVGAALVVGGVAKILTALAGTGDERLLLGLGGAADALVGVLALSWPSVTVLTLAVLVGVRTVLFGLGLAAVAVRLRRAPARPWEPGVRWSRRVRLVATTGALVVALGGLAASVAIDRARPARPGPFYRAPAPLPGGPPGTIIRQEVVAGFHAGATAYRVLYRSTGVDGRPVAVSGLVVVPDGAPPPGGRRVVAYTHGTVGVASSCAPSLQPGAGQPLFLEGGAALLDAGYVIAATDYEGLGTAGPHPYLVGASEAMNALDAVRAARRIPAAHASADVAVWGHSQGGHAALFTGQLAPTYAPELHVVGVAAGAPVPDLVELFKVNVRTLIGKVLIAMALQAWAGVYHDAELDRILVPAARPLVARIARGCLYGQGQIVASVPSALLLELAFLHTPPWEAEPWRTIAATNTPGGVRIRAPVLVVQGGADTIVDPDVTRGFVRRLCARGDEVELRLYPGVGHVATGHDAAPDVVRWIADRFAGRPASRTCG